MIEHVDRRAEAAVIAAVLQDIPAVNRAVIVDEGVRGHHFTDATMAAVMSACVALHDTDSGTAPAIVFAKLSGRVSAQKLDSLTGGDWSVGSLRSYCQILIEQHAWRTRSHALEQLRGAVALHDETELDRALTALAAADAKDAGGAYTGEQITERVLAHIDGKTERPVWTWPLRQLNELTNGGLRRGQVTLISGPTRHGKSVFLDQVLEQTCRDGATARLYLNEMSSDERGMRCTARGAVVNHGHVINGELSPAEARAVMRWANDGGVRFDMQECDGWSAQDIARDARHRRADIVAVDLLDEVPLIPGTSRRETAEESMRVFKQLALGAGCHVFVVAHLNRNRSSLQAYVPIPSLNDVRESGMLVNRSHNVVFVWREQDKETGDPEEDGFIRLAKARAGRLGSVPVLFDGDRQRFHPNNSPDLRSVA